jgi:Leu/Phe-tRNA-protein transferase
MRACRIRYTSTGHILIAPGDNLDGIVDAMLYTHYDEEFCLALDFTPPFIADLMAAGFLVMSAALGEPSREADGGGAPRFLLLPKLHRERSVLFWEDLHMGKTIRRALNRYELRVDWEFDRILERCASVHGEDWLTRPLRESLGQVRRGGDPRVRPVSFGVYRAGELRAGEVGVAAGRVYTSYSGYHDEDSAGTAQMVLTAQYLRNEGFAFLDLGMPMEYKDRLGARSLTPHRFVPLFRQART